MTIHYDAQDHFGVISTLKGSVWEKVTFVCFLNACLTLVVYYLKENYGFAGISINDKGHTFLSVLVSFLVITRLSITYSNFWQCRGIVNNMYHSARRISSKVAVYTMNEESEKAQEYRDLVRECLLRLVASTTCIIMDRYLSIKLMEGVVLTTVKLNKIYLLREKDHDLQNDEIQNLIPLEDPLVLGLDLHAAITSHKKYLSEENGIHILQEMDLSKQLNTYMASYHDLVKTSSTPFPFPLVQMAFTLVDVWLFSLPFALSNDIENKFACSAIIFFITFGFTGIEWVATELQDPFGTDPNDLEMEKYRDRAAHGIQNDLDEQYTSLDEWFDKDEICEGDSTAADPTVVDEESVLGKPVLRRHHKRGNFNWKKVLGHNLTRRKKKVEL